MARSMHLALLVVVILTTHSFFVTPATAALIYEVDMFSSDTSSGQMSATDADIKLEAGDWVAFDIYSDDAAGVWIEYDVDTKPAGNSFFQTSQDVEVLLLDKDSYEKWVNGYSFNHFTDFKGGPSAFPSLSWTYFTFDSSDKRDSYLVISRRASNYYAVEIDYAIALDFRFPASSPTPTPSSPTPTPSSPTPTPRYDTPTNAPTGVCASSGITDKPTCTTFCKNNSPNSSFNIQFQSTNSILSCKCLSTGFSCLSNIAPVETPASTPPSTAIYSGGAKSNQRVAGPLFLISAGLLSWVM